jgi:hypothetical protein
MAVVRLLVLLLLLGAIACFGLYIFTGHKGWLRWGVAIVKWTIIAALVFFAILFFDRLVLAG